MVPQEKQARKPHLWGCLKPWSRERTSQCTEGPGYLPRAC